MEATIPPKPRLVRLLTPGESGLSIDGLILPKSILFGLPYHGSVSITSLMEQNSFSKLVERSNGVLDISEHKGKRLTGYHIAD